MKHRKCPKGHNKKRYSEASFLDEMRNAISEGIAEAILHHPDWIVPKAHGSIHKRVYQRVCTTINRRRNSD